MQSYHTVRRIGSVSLLSNGGLNAFGKGHHARFMRIYKGSYVRPIKAPLPPGISPERAEWLLSRRKEGDWKGSSAERTEQWAAWLRQLARLERRQYAHMWGVWRGMRKFQHNV
jgi:hypothetical protein